MTTSDLYVDSGWLRWEHDKQAYQQEQAPNLLKLDAKRPQQVRYKRI